MLSVILFILLLTFLIIIHELGHFFVARWSKVKIEEFGIGLPPKARTLFHWRGIPITLNWIFLGGFVRMEGEDQGEEIRDKRQETKVSKEFFPFYARPLWQKLLVVLAGPAVNIIFGMVVFSTLYSLYGIPVQTHITPLITQVSEDSPAATAGIKVRDSVTAVSKADGSESRSVSDVKTLIEYINAHRGETIKLQITRDGQSQTVSVYARKPEEIPAKQGTIGVALTDTETRATFYPGMEQLYRGTLYGTEKSLEFGKTVIMAVAGIGKSLAGGKLPGDLSGPVGIAHEVQKQALFSEGWATAFNFAALLSINLGVMNLLPIPALDGGRIVLLIIEKFFPGKKFQALSQNLNQFGFLFLLGVLILITIKDVFGIFFSK